MKNLKTGNDPKKYRYIVVPQLGISMVNDAEIDQLQSVFGTSDVYELRLVKPKSEEVDSE